jgi:hypothetical protein
VGLTWSFYRICPQAFGSPSSNQSEPTYNKKDDLLLYDAGFNRLPAMVFQRRGNKCYLLGGWGDFVSAKNLSKLNDILSEFVSRSAKQQGEDSSLWVVWQLGEF